GNCPGARRRADRGEPAREWCTVCAAAAGSVASDWPGAATRGCRWAAKLKPMRAIDVHVHPTDERVARAWAGDLADAERFFRGPWTHEDLDATAERFRKLDVFAVLLGADAETTTGVPAYPNDELAAAVRKHSDVFVGFAGIDPWKGELAARELERSVRDLGLKGAKFHPGRQQFYPN